jgi:two-component system, sensor histidine kinase YesM
VNRKLQDSLNIMETSMDNNIGIIDALINELDYRQEFAYFLDDSNIFSEREKILILQDKRSNWE